MESLSISFVPIKQPPRKSLRIKCFVLWYTAGKRQSCDSKNPCFPRPPVVTLRVQLTGQKPLLFCLLNVYSLTCKFFNLLETQVRPHFGAAQGLRLWVQEPLGGVKNLSCLHHSLLGNKRAPGSFQRASSTSTCAPNSRASSPVQ
jgi:hypothetical protein